MQYKKETFPEPQCPDGYPWTQLEDAFDEDTFKEFRHWMGGQTMSICEGRKYNHDTNQYEPDECAGSPHGAVAYRYDVFRFLGFLGRYHKELWD